MPQNFLSHFNNVLAVPGDAGIEYTAGPNIEIEDHIISGRDWTSDINAAIKGVKGSGFSATTAWVDSQGYLTEHQDVSDLPYVQNSALDFSPQNLISGISGTGLYATSADAAFLAETANYAVYSDEAGSAAKAESANHADSAYSALTAAFANSANSSLNAQIANYAYTAEVANNLTGWTYTDSAMTGIKGIGEIPFIAENLNYWDYTDSAHTAISGYNGTAFTNEDINCPWISGNKVISNVTAEFGNSFQFISSFDFSGDKNHFISLKGSWITFPTTAHIASALNNKLETSAFNYFIESGFLPNMSELHDATANLNNVFNSACVHNSALNYTIDTKISAISGIPLYCKYTAGPNININASNGISGKDWTDTITAASSYAASMATGRLYTGVAPIVVNNAEEKISANTMELIAGNGIEFVTGATATTINCTAGGANVHYYIDTPDDHTSADIELTIQTTGTIGGRYDTWLMNSGNFIGALIPSANNVDDGGKVLTVTAGSPKWMSLPSGALGIPVFAVSTSAQATAGTNGVLYIVTGN